MLFWMRLTTKKLGSKTIFDPKTNFRTKSISKDNFLKMFRSKNSFFKKNVYKKVVFEKTFI